MNRTNLSTNGVDCACKDCTDRYIGCHAQCEKYKEFVKKNEEIRRQRKYDSLYNGVKERN